MTRKTILFLMLSLPVWPLAAQQTPERPAAEQEEEGGEEKARFTYWRSVLPGGTFLVSHDAITSISQHEYLVDGAARVAEVSIATAGAVQARFYFIEPATPQSPTNAGQSGMQIIQDRIQQGAERTGLDETWRKVVKNYPTTTHAHTVEYRLATREELDRLFENAQRSWMRRRSDTFRP